jgi:hypothetical protein
VHVRLLLITPGQGVCRDVLLPGFVFHLKTVAKKLAHPCVLVLSCMHQPVQPKSLS